MKAKIKKPIAVLISDIHYSINTLELADEALKIAIEKARTLGVKLVICGDGHDTKANLRGECANALVKTLGSPSALDLKQIIWNIGNHDRLNEKGKEHGLHFLEKYCCLINEPTEVFLTPKDRAIVIPYYSDPDELRAYISTIPKDKMLLMHQGLKSAGAGDYIQDHSALSPEDLAGRRVISGHYHTRQTRTLPDGGIFDYVGNPYTLTFGESRDPEKGYQILYNDSSLEFIPTKLRKHVVIELRVTDSIEVLNKLYLPRLNDIVLVKAEGTKEALSKWGKDRIKAQLGIGSFRLDAIPLDTSPAGSAIRSEGESAGNILDSIIDASPNTTSVKKGRLKQLWRDFK